MLSAKVASSGVKSPYYSEYRQGRVPGSPGLDQLRAQADLGNAPSQFSAGSTRKNLFDSEASAIRDSKDPDTQQLERELEQVCRCQGGGLLPCSSA